MPNGQRSPAAAQDRTSRRLMQRVLSVTDLRRALSGASVFWAARWILQAHERALQLDSSIRTSSGVHRFDEAIEAARAKQSELSASSRLRSMVVSLDSVCSKAIARRQPFARARKRPTRRSRARLLRVATPCLCRRRNRSRSTIAVERRRRRLLLMRPHSNRIRVFEADQRSTPRSVSRSGTAATGQTARTSRRIAPPAALKSWGLADTDDRQMP